jgi:hypothetical protein
LNRIILTAIVLVLAVGFATTAEAASVNSVIVQDQISINTADDASAEYISNGGTGTNDYDTTRTLSVGDVIRGSFNISRINSSSTNVGVNGVNEWSGAFSIKVKSITEVDSTPDGNVAEQDWTIVFEADDNFDDWLNSIQSGKGANMQRGTMIRMWEDTSPDFDIQALAGDANAENADAHVLTAMDGAWYWDFGFGQNGSLWIATLSALVAPADTTAALAVSPANFELSLLNKAPGTTVGIKTGAVLGAFGNMVDVAGNTSILGAGFNGATVIANEETAGFHARDKASFQFVAVPVPQAVWLGLALMGFIGVRNVRRRKAA